MKLKKIKTLAEEDSNKQWALAMRDKIEELVKATNVLNVVAEIFFERFDIIKKALEGEKDGEVNS